MMLYYLSASRSYRLVLGLIELMLLFLFLFFLWRSKPQRMQQKKGKDFAVQKKFLTDHWNRNDQKTETGKK